MVPLCAILIAFFGVPDWLPYFSINLTTSIPSTTSPDKEYLSWAPNVQSKLTENDMLSIQPGRRHCRDEELRTVGVWASVSHGEQALLSVLYLEVLI
jgi:hypothetical protein